MAVLEGPWKIFSFFPFWALPKSNQGLYGLENKQDLFSEALVYRDCTTELSRERGSPKVWRGGSGNGERDGLFRTWNNRDLHFSLSQCPGTQEPHQRSPFPILAMEGMESLPLNNPWGSYWASLQWTSQ